MQSNQLVSAQKCECALKRQIITIIYTIEDHIHNYAVWAAARAVQRNFTDTKSIQAAIDKTELKTFVDCNREMTNDLFDEFHCATARKIIDFLSFKNIDTTYGRAAKIIAIYLKTAVIIRYSQCSIAKIAHPPIDNILLTRLNKAHPDMGLCGIKWTQLDEKSYFNIINKLRTLNLDCFWQIEEYWTPVQNE